VRPPFHCFWCRQDFATWDGPCGCVLKHGVTEFGTVAERPRKLFLDLTVRDLATQGWRRGREVKLDFYAPTPTELLAEVAEVYEHQDGEDERWHEESTKRLRSVLRPR
jgi:hypothetical protein